MLKWVRRVAWLLLALAALAALAAWLLLRGSLPRLDDERALTGLTAPVSVQRDALGVITIDAASESDALRALGYVHAQERFFEMDLLRRTAAGELAELFGSRAVELDKAHRAHRFRRRSAQHMARIAGDRRPQLDAYVAGVNAGLADLPVRPWPYLLLRQKPRAWTAEDTPLVGYAMYFDLQGGDNARELALTRMRPHLPPALFALLTHDGTRWDAPLLGAARGDAALPPASVANLRALASPTRADVRAVPAKGAPGSNNFAVSGALTRDGRAIVADDMHLGLRAPDIWFRARLRYPDPRAAGGRVDVQGFTLPGLPAVVVGSNGRVAWAFTNSYGDYLDWKRETACPEAGKRTRGCAQMRRHRESIAIAGGEAVMHEVMESDWGPVLQRAPDGSLLSLRWTAHLPGSINLGLTRLAVARSVSDALRIADTAAVPTQNLLLADADGRIAWRLIGPLPQRAPDCAPAARIQSDTAGTPEDADAGGCPPWPSSTAASPRLESPSFDRLWTANHRTLDGDALLRVGDGGYALGARAKQIRDGLFARERFDERDLLAIQLDDRALFLAPWWKLLREQAARAGRPALSELASAAQRWEGRAVPESVSYRIVRAWRLAVHARIADGLTAPAQAALGEDFVMPDFPQLEGVVWPLLTQRPVHLLSRRYASWDALLEDAAKEVREELSQAGPLSQRTWGERNTAAICHPLAKAIPLIGKRLLCMPPDQLAGDGAMPRVAGPAFGASQRMVVSPGHEADGIVHMPGGQSGHFLSPFWGAGHEDWVHGRPTPFLPGPATHTLRLLPQP